MRNQLRPESFARWIPVILLCLPLVAAAQDASSAESAATDPIFRVSGPRTHTRIVERFSKVVELPTRIRRVDGFDPEVLNVTGIQERPNQIRVLAVTPGVTTLSLTDESGAIFNIEVFVTGDVRHLQAYLERMFPHASVEAVEVRDSVVLSGWVTQPANITKMVEIAEQFYPRVLNQMEVGGAQQVQLRVRVMEVQRSKLRQLGINWQYNRAGDFLNVAASVLDTTQVTAGVVSDTSTFTTFIQALKTESLLKILAEPELVTTNGRPANMLAGGEFPILVPQSLGTTTIEWREFGVRLEAVPHILGRGRVRLELQPEVSERDFTNAVSINGTTIPALTSRRVNTQVEMRFGETFVLAGLISSRRDSTMQKIPLFGELPWIGAAFRRVNYTDAETELVIMVTPELVGPLGRCEVPPRGPGRFTDIPTDRELFRDGLNEVPYYGEHCPDCGPGLHGPDSVHCDPIGGDYPGESFHHATPGGAIPGGTIPGGTVPGGPIPGEAYPPATSPTPFGPAFGPTTSTDAKRGTGRTAEGTSPAKSNRPSGRPGLIGPRSNRVEQVSGRQAAP